MPIKAVLVEIMKRCFLKTDMRRGVYPVRTLPTPVGGKGRYSRWECNSPIGRMRSARSNGVYCLVIIFAVGGLLMFVGPDLVVGQAQAPDSTSITATSTETPSPTPPAQPPPPPQGTPSDVPNEEPRPEVCPLVLAPECVPEWRNKACQEVMRKLAQQYPHCGFEVYYDYEGSLRDFQVRGKIVDITTGKGFKGIKIQAWSREVEGEYAEAITNEDGTFTLFVFKGAWQFLPTLEETNYRHVGEEAIVTAPQKEGESATILLQLQLPVAGKILHGPGANPKTPYSLTFSRIRDTQTTPSSIAGEDVYTFEVAASGGDFKTDGIPEGGYTVALWNEDPTILLPDPVTLGIQRDKAKEGVLILPPFEIKSTADKIQGRVFNILDKKGVKGLTVVAQSESGRYAYFETKTDAEGNYEFTVFPGPWLVWIEVDDRKDIVQGANAGQVSVEPRIVAKFDFPVLTADATVNGIVTLDGATPLEDLTAYVEFHPGEGQVELPVLGVNAERGRFSILLPAAAYGVWLHLPSGSEYALTTIQPFQQVVLASGASQEVSVTVKKRDVIIDGSLKNAGGARITAVPAKVYAEANGITEETEVDPSTGRYELRVYSGVYRTWNLSLAIGETKQLFFADQNANYAQPVSANSRVTQDFILYEADSRISGKVFDAEGKPLHEITVTAAIDWWDAEGNPRDPKAPYFESYTATGKDGGYEFLLPAGTYRLSASAEGLLSPDAKVLKITPQQPGQADFRFLPQEATIAGQVRLSDKGVLSWVSAWSEGGAAINTNTDAAGKFVLRASHDVWHLSAVATIGNRYYVSDEVLINTREQPSSNTVLNLRLEREYVLPAPTIRAFDAESLTVVTLDDGAKITIPAGAILKGGKLTLVASPSVFLPVEADARPIGLGYDLQVKNERGRNIVTFLADVFVAIPYTPEQLQLFGLTEENLVPAYWDEKANAWLPVKNVTVDREHRFIVIATNHFTKFALVTHQRIATVADIPPVAVRQVSSEQLREAIEEISAGPVWLRWHVLVSIGVLAGILAILGFTIRFKRAGRGL